MTCTSLATLCYSIYGGRGTAWGTGDCLGEGDCLGDGGLLEGRWTAWGTGGLLGGGGLLGVQELFYSFLPNVHTRNELVHEDIRTFLIFQRRRENMVGMFIEGTLLFLNHVAETPFHNGHHCVIQTINRNLGRERRK